MTKKTFIIAEIGINHNGSLDIAKKLIKKCKDAGADAVKFQKRDINLVYSKEELDKDRESPFGKTNRDQKIGLEFEEKEYDEIDKYCKELDIEWFASAWDFISTGMSSYKEIDAAVEIFKKEKCDFELMHCVAKYPFEAKDASLNLIKDMRDRYNCKVGYSGHEKSGLVISLAAVTLGATSIERHITLDRTMYGSDQAASLHILGFADLVESVRIVESAIDGEKEKKLLDIEIEVANKLRKHIKN